MDGYKGVSSVIGEAVCVVFQRAGEVFGLFAGRAGLRVIRRSDLATKATEQRPESRDASDDYVDIDLNYGPFDDGLRIAVIDKACNRLDAEALNDGYEETKPVKEGQGNPFLISADCHGHQGNNETDFTTFVKFQATEYGEWNRDNEQVPRKARTPKSEVHGKGVDIVPRIAVVPFYGIHAVSRGTLMIEVVDSRIATGKQDTACRMAKRSWFVATSTMHT